MISIVTGTLNRCHLLPKLISNTVDSDERLELVLVDGGSDDGTLEYVKNLNHPRVKLLEVGGRSSYPHFMNLGVEHATHEWICQWNDDALLVNSWSEVINIIDNETDFYLFNWKYGNESDMSSQAWLNGDDTKSGWCLLDETYKPNGEIVMNYGLYNKKIFRTIGLYNNSYRYYYADGDMAYRANRFGFKHKGLRMVKVCSIYTEKKAEHFGEDQSIYVNNIKCYNEGVLPLNLDYLK